MKDRNARITELDARMPNSSALCGFAGNAEAETIVYQTIAVSAQSISRGIEPYSFKGLARGCDRAGTDNASGLGLAIARGWIIQEPRAIDDHRECCVDGNGDPIVLLVTDRLLGAAEAHLDKREAS